MLYLAHYWTLWAAGHTHLIVALSHHHPRHHRWHLGNWPHIKVALDQNGQSLTTKCFEVYTGCWSSTLLKVGPSPPMYSIGRRISICLLRCYPDLKGSIIPVYMEGLVMNGILHQSLGGVGRSTFGKFLGHRGGISPCLPHFDGTRRQCAFDINKQASVVTLCTFIVLAFVASSPRWFPGGLAVGVWLNLYRQWTLSAFPLAGGDF